ncbi:MAG: autoinducer synthase [Proteobacteria bacterium]|nr:autoinducer synthase [Pseudomonadota bacterium]
MLRYIYGDDLHRHPDLARAMFRDRARQFRDRLGWPVDVDADGQERDGYDALNPLYVLWQNSDGGHGGSMRFLPTTGPVMVNDIFGHLTGGAPVISPLIWECTRFCLAPGADPHVAAALMLGGGEIMRNFAVRHFVGVFDARMVRIYRAIGSSPEILGSEGEGRARISVGLWAFSDEARARVADRAGIAPAQSQVWFDAAFGTPRAAVPA